MNHSENKRWLVVWMCTLSGLLQAADRNWSTGANVQWSNTTTWAEGAVPTADDNVTLIPDSSIYIGTGVDAVAKTVAFSNTVNIQNLYINDGGSLTVGGAITDPGAGSAYFRVSNSTSNRCDRVLTASSLAAQELSLTVGTGPQYMTTGYDMTLSSLLCVNLGAVAYGHIFRQTNGVISIANGSGTYSLVLMESYTQPTANSYGRFILDGGTLKAERVGAGNGNGNNKNTDHYVGQGYFEFNNGTVQTRTSGGTLSFHNGSGYENYSGSGTKDMQFNTSKPTTIELAQNGTHAFNADGSSGTIIISPSAQMADKPGEAGSLLKTGAGDLVFTGGGLAATNTWSGDTTVTNGRIRVNYSSIAGAAGDLVLTNAYSPASKLILNGGGFDLTGRANATNNSFDAVMIPADNFRPIQMTLPSTAGLTIGQRALNAYLPTNTYIRRILSSTQVELNAMSISVNTQYQQMVVFEAANFACGQTISNVELDATSSAVSVTPAGSGTLLNFVNVSGPGGIAKSGTGPLRLTGSISYTGTTAITAGTLDFASAGHTALSNVVSGSGTFRHSGTGVTVIDATTGNFHSFSGAVIVDGGTLQMGTAGTNQYRGLVKATSYTVNSGATLLASRDSMNTSVPFVLNGGTLTMTGANGAQMIASLTMSGGTLIPAYGCGTAWQAVMLYGDVVVTGSVSSVIRAGPGTYNAINLTAYSAAAGSLRAFRVDDVTGDTNIDLTISANLWNRTGNITVPAGVLKTGAGTLLLSASANMYNGATVVSNGTLLVCGAGGITGSVVTVVSGATFGAYGTNVARVAGLTLNEGAKLVWSYDGDAHKAGRIEVRGTLTLPATATLDTDGNGFLYSNQTLISASAVSGATDLSGWTINGAPNNSHTVVVGNTVRLLVNRGTLLRIQ